MAKVNSTTSPRRRKPRKPDKPHKGFPLFAHANGQWAKKVRGKMHFFGVWKNPDEAINRWLEEKDALLAGKVPRSRRAGSRDTLTLEDLITRFLTTKGLMRDAGELSPFTWNSYADVCNQLLAAFGKDRFLTDILPEDFEQLRAKWAESCGPVRLGAEINRARVVFNYAEKNKLVPRGTIEFGEGFKRPSKKVMRLHRADQGKKMFEADELRRMIDTPTQPLKAMLLLAINAGLGNNDIGQLRMKHLNLTTGWLDYPRPKTGMERRCPLWKETVAEIKDWLTVRPAPANEADADLVFITNKDKQGWTADLKARPLTNATRLLLNQLKIKGRRNFYAIRHTFETIGGNSRDQVAVDAIMGHDEGSIGNIYRERIEDERLKAVTDHVHRWLFAEAEKTPGLKLHVSHGDSPPAEEVVA